MPLSAYPQKWFHFCGERPSIFHDKGITMMKDMLLSLSGLKRNTFLSLGLTFLSPFRTTGLVISSLISPQLTGYWARCGARLGLSPFTSTLRRSSPLVFRGIKFARITPAHLHKLKQGNVIYLLPLVVPFSWLCEITANINRGYKKGLWTLGRVDYGMNQFINGGPRSNAGEGGIYSFIKLCLQHLSSPKSRAPKM